MNRCFSSSLPYSSKTGAARLMPMPSGGPGRAGLSGGPAPNGSPARAPGQRSGRGDPVGKRARGPSQLASTTEPAGQSNRSSLTPANPPAGIEQLRRALLANNGRQRDAQGESLMQADPGEGRAEPGLRARNPEVGGAGKAEAAPDRRALHRRHHPDRGLKEAQRLLVELPRAAADVEAR